MLYQGCWNFEASEKIKLDNETNSTSQARARHCAYQRAGSGGETQTRGDTALSKAVKTVLGSSKPPWCGRLARGINRKLAQVYHWKAWTVCKGKEGQKPDLGVSNGTVKLVPHSPLWIKYFEAEKKVLQKILGDRVVEIRHFGSTAIPGIWAKPIIDIMVGLRQLQDMEICIEIMRANGYDLYEGTLTIPNWRLMIKHNGTHKATHHAHVIEYNGEFWTPRKRFQEYLSSHPELAEAYERLKLDLAQRYPDDRDAYNKGKEDFILAVNDMALRADHHAQSEGDEEAPPFKAVSLD